MDFKQTQKSVTSSSMMNDSFMNTNPNLPCYDVSSQQAFLGFSSPLETRPNPLYRSGEVKRHDQFDAPPSLSNPILDWDPRAMLSNLSFLEHRIHQVQDIVRSMAGHEGQLSNRANEVAAQQQQLVTADLTCIIIQLISTAGTLLPSVKNTLLSTSPSVLQAGSILSSPSSLGLNEVSLIETKVSEYDELIKSLNGCGDEGNELINCEEQRTHPIEIEEHDMKDFENGGDVEHLPPGSYEILQLEKEEILAPHTHFCCICGKGFKRDANLRMHMRGHGDEYKTLAALAKPSRESSSESVIVKRYSCPFVGCKRNKDHKKFQPLKTILCVKNHYKRSHCDKSYTCSKCHTKKFSVIADLKTHEKHCRRDKWLCSCGTSFSRKDKLFGHVALFQGHTPALPSVDNTKLSVAMDQMQSNGMMKRGDAIYDFGSTSDDVSLLDSKLVDDDQGFLSAMNIESCNFGGFDGFSHPSYEVSDLFEKMEGSQQF